MKLNVLFLLQMTSVPGHRLMILGRWLLDKLVEPSSQLPASRPVVNFSCSLHRIAPVRDVISTSESSLPYVVFRVKALLPYFSGCITFAQTGGCDLAMLGRSEKRVCVDWEGKTNSFPCIRSFLNHLFSPLLCTLSLLSSVLHPTSQPFFLSPPGRSEPFPCIAWPRIFCRGDAFLALCCPSLLTKT